MTNKEADEPKDFQQLEPNDKDLVMFYITDLRLEKRKDQVHMVINLKRKIQTELHKRHRHNCIRKNCSLQYL